MNWNRYFPMLETAFDKERCLQILREIWQNDRWFSFSAFARTAAVCAGWMEQSGAEEIERISLAADGKTPYGDWVLPRAWDANEASLTMDDGRVLADYHTTPCSLIMYSAPTPPEGICAEVVCVDDPASTPPDSVSKRLILTGRPAKELVSLAVKGGAYGILSDYFPLYPGVRDSREEMHGVSRWDNDFIVPINNTGLFGFSLSPENGELLRGLCSKGPVLLHAKVATRFYEGSCDTVSGAILGEKPELPEIFAYGHLYEPGADDNASGCAVLLELISALNTLIGEGLLPRPKRTIRFTMGYECAGSMGYLHAHPERIGHTLCGIIADMVGTETIDRTHLCLWHDPLSHYSFADLLLPAINRDYQLFRDASHPSEEKPFSVGSDNILADPIWNMPTVAMITEPALSYHSSLDTPERIDPDILKRDAVILGSFLLYLANAGDETVDALLREAEHTALPTLAKKSFYLSLLRLSPEREDLEQAAQKAEFPIPQMAADITGVGGGLIPVRKIPGCLTFAPKPELQGAPWQPAWNDTLNLPLFWVDGKRNLWEIAVCSAEESGKSGADAYREQFAWLREYFEFLVEHGYLEWSSRI